MKISKIIAIAGIAAMLQACSGQQVAPYNQVTIGYGLPETVAGDYVIQNGSVTFDEINTGWTSTFALPMTTAAIVPVGVYNISAQMQVASAGQTLHLKTASYQQTISTDATVDLKWWVYNPQNTLVFGEMFFTGSLNAKGTGGLFDTYFTIYNNSDQVQYADGIAVVESKLHNATTDQLLTEANDRNTNFTAQAIYVIPGSGHDVPIMPGKSIKIVDQAIDWSEQVDWALDHTDADFEWYDLSTSASVVDTDNPSVPNLDKWFCYTLTIWLPSNQCNRSYALVRFPEDMTMERFLVEQVGDYDYINAATGIQMHAEKCFLIKPEWIIDGVNLCPTEKFTQTALPLSVDAGYAAISPKNADANRFGLKFARKVSATTADGVVLLQDTDNSANDFDVLKVRQ